MVFREKWSGIHWSVMITLIPATLVLSTPLHERKNSFEVRKSRGRCTDLARVIFRTSLIYLCMRTENELPETAGNWLIHYNFDFHRLWPFNATTQALVNDRKARRPRAICIVGLDHLWNGVWSVTTLISTTFGLPAPLNIHKLSIAVQTSRLWSI